MSKKHHKSFIKVLCMNQINIFVVKPNLHDYFYMRNSQKSKTLLLQIMIKYDLSRPVKKHQLFYFIYFFINIAVKPRMAYLSYMYLFSCTFKFFNFWSSAVPVPIHFHCMKKSVHSLKCHLLCCSMKETKIMQVLKDNKVSK